MADRHTSVALYHFVLMALIFLQFMDPVLANPVRYIARQVPSSDTSSSVTSTPPTDPSSSTTDVAFSITNTQIPPTNTQTDTFAATPSDILSSISESSLSTASEFSTRTSISSSTSTSTTSPSDTPTPPIPSSVTPPTTPPTTSSTTSTNNHSSVSHHTNSGAIVGGVIGGLFALAILMLIYPFLKRRPTIWGRTRGINDIGRSPPSPRLHHPWQSTSPNGSTFDSLRPRRLRSLNDGEGFPGVESGAVRDTATGGDLRASINSGTAAVPGGVGSRHGRTSSKGTASNVVPEATYDLEVFRNAVMGDNMDPSRSQSSFHADTFVNESSTDPGTTNVSRNPSVNRVARKPAPTYIEGGSTLPKSAVRKPPVAGTGMGRVRSRTSGNSRPSTGSGDSALSGELSDKGSVKFYGEKEGPVHYLTPDLPLSTIS